MTCGEKKNYSQVWWRCRSWQRNSVPLPCTEHQHHPRGLQPRSGAFLVPLSCFPRGCGNPRGGENLLRGSTGPRPTRPGLPQLCLPFPRTSAAPRLVFPCAAAKKRSVRAPRGREIIQPRNSAPLSPPRSRSLAVRGAESEGCSPQPQKTYVGHGGEVVNLHLDQFLPILLDFAQQRGRFRVLQRPAGLLVVIHHLWGAVGGFWGAPKEPGPRLNREQPQEELGWGRFGGTGLGLSSWWVPCWSVWVKTGLKMVF